MKHLRPIILICGMAFFSCTHNTQSLENTERKTESLESTGYTEDKEEIQNLIRQVLIWSDLEKNNDILPVLTDSKDSIVVGIDLEQHKVNLTQLKETNFFASEFIENYDKVILTLDAKLRNKESDDWLTGEMPPFNFASGVDPWCLCQDVPYDNPNPWNFVEVKPIVLNNEMGELDWKWGNLKEGQHPDWEDFAYRFRVSKEIGKWKVSYLQGFDFDESTK